MITIAVANVLESSEQAIQFIYDMSKKRGIKILSISPKDKILYKNNKKIRLKEYINNVKGIDLLVMNLDKKAIENQIYENIKFDITVLFDNKYKKNRIEYLTEHLNQKLLKKINSDFYIIPDSYKSKKTEYITYGWSQSAHLSASSAQQGAEGDTNLQCCIQNILPSFLGNITIPREFNIQSNLNNIEGMLAGIATMLLYGINIE
ncbi:MAG: hypothetical protein ACRC1P_07270 [Cellulosilyticaceae bacterium]